MWKETTQHERNLEIFRDEIDDFLPETVLDFHVHVFNEGVVPSGEVFSCAGHPIGGYDLGELGRDLEATYPGRRTLAVCFGMPDVSYNRARNNQYLARGCDRERFFPLRLFDPVEDTPNELARDLKDGGFLGIKPYPDYARKPDIHSVEIPDMLPDWALELVHDQGGIVMLHIPRRGRLADPVNQRQVADICTRYPRARIVLAHIGRAYFLRNIAGQLDALRRFPNLYFDLAMLNNWEVLEVAFREIHPERILYGTDIPLALAPGKSVEINHQYAYITPVPWKLSISDDAGKIAYTSFVYEELRAIRKAAERLGLGSDFFRRLFFENGMRLLAVE